MGSMGTTSPCADVLILISGACGASEYLREIVPKFVVTEPGVFFFGYNRCTVPAAAGESVDDVVTAPLDFLKADVRVFAVNQSYQSPASLRACAGVNDRPVPSRTARMAMMLPSTSADHSLNCRCASRLSVLAGRKNLAS
jgi:hypothetical protein